LVFYFIQLIDYVYKDDKHYHRPSNKCYCSLNPTSISSNPDTTNIFNDLGKVDYNIWDYNDIYYDYPTNFSDDDYFHYDETTDYV